MNKPHWRCDRCDTSRFKVIDKGEIKCYNCGLQIHSNVMGKEI